MPVAPAGSGLPIPRVGVDARGNAIAVWRSGPFGEKTVRAAVRPAGGAWQPPSVLSAVSRDEYSSGVLDLAVSANGDAVAVWLMTAGASSVVQAAVRPAGGAWQPPVDLARDAHEPQVAIDSSGNAIATWLQTGITPSGRATMMSAARPAGGAWNTPTRVDRSDGLATSAPRVALDAHGTAHAVWRHESGPLMSALRPAGGDWQPPIEFATPDMNILSRGDVANGEPELAVAPSGDEVAVWMRTKDGRNVMQAAGRTRGGAWERPVDISAPERISGPRAYSEISDVVFDANRTAIATWTRLGGTGAQASTRPLGGAWSAPTAVFDQQAALRLAADPLGNTFGVWPSGAIAAVLHRAGAWLPAVTVSSSTNAREVVVAGDPRGGAVAVWADESGGVHSADYVDRTAVVSGLRVAPRRFKTRGRVSYALDLAARVRIAVEQQRSGRRAGGRCVALTRRNRGRPSCSRYVRVRRLERSRAAGVDAFTLSGRSLRPGRYRLTATPVTRATPGVAARVRFRILR